MVIKIMIHIVNELDEITWRQYIQSHPHSNIFHTPEMFQVFARAKGHHPTLWAAVDNGSRILVLLTPVCITLLSEPLRSFATRAVAYGSVLCAPGAEGQAALTKLLKVYKGETKEVPLFTELRNLVDMSDAQPTLAAAHFVHENHLNYLIDLKRSPEALLQSFNSSTRKIIRRRLSRSDVVIEEANTPGQIAVCYELLRRTYHAVRVPLPDISLFQAAFHLLRPCRMLQVLLARVGDTYASCLLQLVYKDTIYGWYGGMDRDYASYTPNEMLFWHAFKWGTENSCCVYDFGGAGKPGEYYGPREFKSKFGGTLVNFGRNTYIHAPIRLKISQTGYRFLKRFL